MDVPCRARWPARVSGLGAASALVNPRQLRLHADEPLSSFQRLEFSSDVDPLNHRVFRFPARFHPPVVRELIRRHAPIGSIVCDPFSGSGTVAVEALLAGCGAVATDIDPLSVLVTRAKARDYDLAALQREAGQLRRDLVGMRKVDEDAWGSFGQEISSRDFAASAQLASIAPQIPDLPNIEHWFRKRVIIELAAIRARLNTLAGSSVYPLMELCFASIIRNTSNADPVPVSGLEVTRHMLEREALGRTIDPYALLSISIQKAVEAAGRFQEQRKGRGSARVSRADARHLSIRGTGPVDLIITSPPYLTAVDYYRRHTLEMYWLGLTRNQGERAELIPGYLGRDRVGSRYLVGTERTHGASIATRWLAGMPNLKPGRERAFRHYCAGMADALMRMRDLARPGAPVIVVVGDVRFCGHKVSMADLFEDLAPRGLGLVQRLWYPLENRFMTYERQNSADIDVDHILVFRTGR